MRVHWTNTRQKFRLKPFAVSVLNYLIRLMALVYTEEVRCPGQRDEDIDDSLLVSTPKARRSESSDLVGRVEAKLRDSMMH